METDDELPVGDDVDYNTDSCSDQEGDISELDDAIRQHPLRLGGGDAEGEASRGQVCGLQPHGGLWISSR